MTPYDQRHRIEVVCPHCGTNFDVPKSQAGGMANCPECGRVVPVPGGYGSEFWLLWGLAVGFVALVSWGAFAAGGMTAGLTVLLIGLAIIAAVTLAS